MASVVAVFPALSCPTGLRGAGAGAGAGAGEGAARTAGSRRAPLFTPLVCKHNGVRILWGGFVSTGLGQCRVRTGYGVVRAVEETTSTTSSVKAAPKSRRRGKKPVKAVEDVPGSDRAASELESDSESVVPAARRQRSSVRGRKAKVVEPSDDSSVLSEQQGVGRSEVLQEIVEKKIEEVSSSGADDELSEDEAPSKPANRRKRRSSAKKIAVGISESNTVANQASEAKLAEEDSEKKKPSTPSGSRSRKKKKPSATGSGKVAAGDVNDSSVDFRILKSSTPDGNPLSSSSPIAQDEHIHGDIVEISKEQSSETSNSRTEPENVEKSVRARKKRGKAADTVKPSGDKEELQIRVQETAVPSRNGSAAILERGTISEEVSSEDHEVRALPVETKAEPGIPNGDVEVKKKRQRKARKKPVAVEGIVEKAAAAQSVLLDEVSGSDPEFNNDSGEDEAVVSPEESTPPKPRTRRRKRQGDAFEQVREVNSEGEGSDLPSEPMGNMFSIGANINGAVDAPQSASLWNGTPVDTDGDRSRVQFPAPTWGPQWWDEIQSKSQATISFQDIAERREGFQTRSKVLQEQVPEDGETVDITQEPAETGLEVVESVEQRIELTEANRDLDVLNKGDSVIRRREVLTKKTGRRIAKTHPAQKPPQESHDEWLKKKMLTLAKPTEEPWLLESMIAAEAEQEFPSPKQEVIEPLATIEEPKRAVSSSSDNSDQKKEPEVEVEILINTSECTMQRMAILENKKLVEFSIEPVNTKVQVGNIYLGRVKQLLPGMSGVFIDIGGSRLALLDIARNQYPYTFPPVYASENASVENAENGALLEDSEDLVPSEEATDYDIEEEEEEEDEDEERYEEFADEVVAEEAEEVDDLQEDKEEEKMVPKGWRPHKQAGPITVNFGRKFSKWRNVEVGMPIIVQVKKEAMGKKGPRLTAFATLAGRFWVLIPRGNTVGVSARITGPERRRLKLLAQSLRPQDLGITVRTEAIGHEQEELERDLTRLIDTWKEITEKAASAALAIERGEEAAVPVLLHREMGQTLSIIRDLFTEKISRLVVDSSQSYQEVINYLQEVAPHLMPRVVLYSGKVPIFDKFNVEVDLDRFSSERVKLPNGGYLVMQETEALVSIDVNGGTGMLGYSTRQREAILDVNLAAAKQIASEIRLRDIGGIIVVDFIDMDNSEDERLVHEEMRKAIQRDRSKVVISEISEFGLMEMTRKRVRSSVTLTIHSPCTACKGTGRVEALETTLSKIERAIRRLLAEHPDVEERTSDASTWPHVLLRVEPSMLEFLKSWKKKRIVQLGHSLKVWISLKAGMELARGQFEVMHKTHKKSNGVSSHGSQHKGSLQQEKAVSSPVLGKRVWPKRKRHFA